MSEQKEVFDKKAIEEQIRNVQRVAFYALLEAAMRYREGFWREDIQTYMDNHTRVLNDTIKAAGLSKQPLKRDFILGQERRIRSMSLNFELKQEKLNNAMYGAIHDLESGLTKESKVAFDNYAAALGDVVEELLKASDMTGFIEHCRAYNKPKEVVLSPEPKRNSYVNKVYVLLYWFYEGDSNLVDSFEGVFNSYEAAKKSLSEADVLLTESDFVVYEDGTRTPKEWGGYDSSPFKKYEIKEIILATEPIGPVTDEVVADGDHLNTGRDNVGSESVEFVVKGGDND